METTASAVPDQMTLALVNTYVVRKAAKLNMFAGSCAQTLLQVQSSLHEARVHLQLLECELAAAAAAAASAAGSADAIDLTTPSRCAVVMPSPRNAPAVSPKRTCQRSPTRRSLSTSEDDTKSCRSGGKFLDEVSRTRWRGCPNGQVGLSTQQHCQLRSATGLAFVDSLTPPQTRHPEKVCHVTSR